MPTHTATVTPVPTDTPTPTPMPSATPIPTPTEHLTTSLSYMVKQARPAVVRVETNSVSGSGAIYEVDGRTAYIITNHHVVEGYKRVRVTVNDREEYQGDVLGADSVRDLAVVKICCGSFTNLAFGDISSLEVGDEVVIIGYALGMPGEATVSRGIVSAMRYDSNYQSDVIQTDAATNPGNSGGPMLSLSGEILGVHTFGIDETSGGRPLQGLGFAISGTTVQERIPILQAVVSSPTPTVIPKPALTRTPAPSAGGMNRFGPISGELWHDVSNGFIEGEYADVSMADMLIEATFINPYSSSYNSWDYGFIFRQNRNAPFIHVAVSSYNNWAVNSGENAPYNHVGGGTLEHLDTGAGGKNHLRVAAIGERGWFFVNGEFVSTLDLSDVTRAGDVAVITGAFEGDEVDEKVTQFEEFSITRLSKRYGPAGGKLVKEPGFIAVHENSVWTRDLVVEAEFISPQGENWDYGFIIRNPEQNWLEVIGITAQSSAFGNSGRWFHKTHASGDSAYTTVAEGPGPGLRPGFGRIISKRAINYLMLKAIGDTGWFFLNGDLVSELDLSHNLDSGWVSVMGDFFLDHQGSPEFEHFNVWAP
ncbi:MAG: trypsin-like serine protease [Dehalococcoidia bacterium]|nr:trypsin-like serine protease [Dehalococcoidia bacterium]